MTALLPDKSPARIILSTTSGEVLYAATETNRGDWSDPFPDAEIKEKYLSLTTRLWHKYAALRIWDMVMDLANAPTLDTLLTEMAQAPR